MADLPDVDVVHVPGQLDLFGQPVDPPAEPAAPLSADRRRTAAQHQLIADGWHPLTRDRARPDLGTCGDCKHREGVGRRSFPKCALGPRTKGPGTDVRASWPACSRFQPLET